MQISSEHFNQMLDVKNFVPSELGWYNTNYTFQHIHCTVLLHHQTIIYILPVLKIWKKIFTGPMGKSLLSYTGPAKCSQVLNPNSPRIWYCLTQWTSKLRTMGSTDQKEAFRCRPRLLVGYWLWNPEIWGPPMWFGVEFQPTWLSLKIIRVAKFSQVWCAQKT